MTHFFRKDVRKKCVKNLREALCAAMERMSSRAEERYRMGQVGKRRVELYYRHNDMVRNYRNVYTEVMTNWRESVSP